MCVSVLCVCWGVCGGGGDAEGVLCVCVWWWAGRWRERGIASYDFNPGTLILKAFTHVVEVLLYVHRNRRLSPQSSGAV